MAHTFAKNQDLPTDGKVYSFHLGIETCERVSKVKTDDEGNQIGGGLPGYMFQLMSAEWDQQQMDNDVHEDDLQPLMVVFATTTTGGLYHCQDYLYEMGIYSDFEEDGKTMVRAADTDEEFANVSGFVKVIHGKDQNGNDQAQLDKSWGKLGIMNDESFKAWEGVGTIRESPSGKDAHSEKILLREVVQVFKNEKSGISIDLDDGKQTEPTTDPDEDVPF